ncbi:MAG TPA: hypothetical protein VES64_10175, partial [Allosphingosinicella sp.]|nr:hypothetical protein [Allosphingosinicella sp.]
MPVSAETETGQQPRPGRKTGRYDGGAGLAWRRRSRAWRTAANDPLSPGEDAAIQLFENVHIIRNVGGQDYLEGVGINATFDVAEVPDAGGFILQVLVDDVIDEE